MDNLRFSTARLATGLRIHYAEQGPGGGEPMVLLHGWPDSWFSYSRVLSLLPASVHAFVPDLPGFGDSEPPERRYSIEDYAEDVLAFLDAIGVERAAIVGHSFGSFVARRIAIAHRDRVERLVLIGTGFTAISPVTREVQAGLAEITDPVSPQFAREFQSGTVHAPVPGAFFERIVAESLKLPARLWREALDAVLAYQDADQLSGITVPTLLLWGDNDALFSREAQDPLLAAIPSARLITYQDTGHCPNWERPERVAADILAFLERAERTAAS